jgi:hypothetical protein
MRQRRPIDTRRSWEVGIRRKDFTKVRDRAEFHALVALARQVNFLRYAQGSILGGEGTSPFARRQTLNSMFLTCSVLFECYRLVPELAKHFRGTPEFGGLQEWRSDKMVSRFINEHCEPVRNKATFHVDWDIIGERLRALEDPFVVFMSSRSKVAGLNTYDLADFVAVQTLVGPCKDAKEFREQARRVAATGARISKRFMREGEGLIAWRMKEGPFEVRQTKDTSESESVVRWLTSSKS